MAGSESESDIEREDDLNALGQKRRRRRKEDSIIANAFPVQNVFAFGLEEEDGALSKLDTQRFKTERMGNLSGFELSLLTEEDEVDDRLKRLVSRHRRQFNCIPPFFLSLSCPKRKKYKK